MQYFKLYIGYDRAALETTVMVKLKNGLWFWFDGQDLSVRKGLHSPKVDALWSRYQKWDVVDEHDVDAKCNLSIPFENGFRNRVHAGRHMYVGSEDLFPLQGANILPIDVFRDSYVGACYRASSKMFDCHIH